MGKSKSKSKTQETFRRSETTAPSSIYAPYINEGADALRQGFQAGNQNVQTLLPRLNEGLDYYGDVLGGKYLTGNPHLEGVIGRTNQSIADSVNSQFSGAGRYGSGYHAGTLADRIAGNENALRYADYATERGYLDNASRGMAGLVTTSAALPQLASSEYAQALAALLGRYGTSNSSGTGTGTSTTTQSQGFGSILGGVLGAGLAGYAGR